MEHSYLRTGWHELVGDKGVSLVGARVGLWLVEPEVPHRRQGVGDGQVAVHLSALVPRHHHALHAAPGRLDGGHSAAGGAGHKDHQGQQWGLSWEGSAHRDPHLGGKRKRGEN